MRKLTSSFTSDTGLYDVLVHAVRTHIIKRLSATMYASGRYYN